MTQLGIEPAHPATGSDALPLHHRGGEFLEYTYEIAYNYCSYSYSFFRIYVGLNNMICSCYIIAFPGYVTIGTTYQLS